ncbi:hypothetical protein HOLleu_15901 [Holothuria leucospilota]|uniref:BRICHOS domain-containing protein n=1 Tax=Holothuria leucospilota TaxID=206669 RepID=A0A9Q1C5V2_HOLLE|nr:hypothetical protein HOLleu_15901 [Holothuria leucospilota]
MAAEKAGLPQDIPVVCTVPPCTEKEATRASKETHIKVLGLVIGVAIIVAGFVGIVHILAPSGSRGEVHTSVSHDDVDMKNEDAVVNFDMSGKRHEEQVSVRNGGQLVTISDTEDGFSVILDYKDGIAVVKNTSSLECYFFPIEKFPEYQTSDMESLKPVVVQSNGENPVKNTGDEKSVTSLVKSGVIPWEFIKTTSDPTVAESCVDSTSYWLEGASESHVQKRQAGGVCICWVLVEYTNGEVWLYWWYCDCATGEPLK